MLLRMTMCQSWRRLEVCKPLKLQRSNCARVLGGWRTEVCKPDLLASICFNALMHCTLLFCNALHFCMLSFCLSLEVQFCTAEHPSFGTGNEHCTHICTAQHNYLGNQLCTLLNCKHIWTTHCTLHTYLGNQDYTAVQTTFPVSADWLRRVQGECNALKCTQKIIMDRDGNCNAMQLDSR